MVHPASGVHSDVLSASPDAGEACGVQAEVYHFYPFAGGQPPITILLQALSKSDAQPVTCAPEPFLFPGWHPKIVHALHDLAAAVPARPSIANGSPGAEWARFMVGNQIEGWCRL